MHLTGTMLTFLLLTALQLMHSSAYNGEYRTSCIEIQNT